MSETITASQHDNEQLHAESALPPMPNLEKYIVKASIHPPHHVSPHEFANYPELPQHLRDLLVEPDSEKEAKDLGYAPASNCDGL